MLKTIGLLVSALRDDDNTIVKDGDDRNLSKSQKSKNAKSGIQTYMGATEEPMFLSFGVKEVFNQLR